MATTLPPKKARISPADLSTTIVDTNTTKNNNETIIIEDDGHLYEYETFCCCGNMLREGVGFVMSAFARSPSIILVALVAPLQLQLAETDAFCQINPATGLSSGVDGMLCSPNGEFARESYPSGWNETLFLGMNGTSCLINVGGVSATPIYQYDIGQATHLNPACMNAMAEYRAVTKFTCNCTGDYGFLESGARPGAILTFSSTIYYFILAIGAPLIGAFADVTSKRKEMWAFFACIYTVSVAGMGIMGSENVWITSILFSTTCGTFYDFMCVPIMAFLPEIHHKEIIRAKYAGASQGANYAAQFIFGIIMLMVVVSLGSYGSIRVTQSCCVLAAIWVGTFMTYAYKKMAPRPAGHPINEGESLCRAAFGSIHSTSKLLYNEYPQAALYLCVNFFGNTGIVVNIALLTTYLVVQMEMAGSQIVGVYLLVMLTGAPVSTSYGYLNKKFGAKPIYIALMIFAMLANGIMPFFINQPKDQYAVFLFAPVAGAYFGMFFAMQSLIYSNFIPVGEEAACYGLLAFSSAIVRWIPPLVYGAIVQTTNDHRLGLLHICIFYLMGAVVMCFVDFDKGKADVSRKGKVRSCSISLGSEPSPSPTKKNRKTIGDDGDDVDGDGDGPKGKYKTVGKGLLQDELLPIGIIARSIVGGEKNGMESEAIAVKEEEFQAATKVSL